MSDGPIRSTLEKTPAGKLRPKEAWVDSRKGEILRAMRDSAEAQTLIPIEWVKELGELLGVDLRKR